MTTTDRPYPFFSVTVRFCPHCGMPILKTMGQSPVKFCPHCGTPIMNTGDKDK